MPLIKWESSFELGIAEFDKHHKHLVELMNAIHDEIAQNKGEIEVSRVLGELIDYAGYHLLPRNTGCRNTISPGWKAIKRSMPFSLHRSQICNMLWAVDTGPLSRRFWNS